MQCCCSASRPPRGRCLALGAVGEVVIKVRRASVYTAAAVPALEVGVRRASVYAAATVPALEVGAAMEVQGCGEDCDFVCSEYGWPVIDHCNYTCVITL